MWDTHTPTLTFTLTHTPIIPHMSVNVLNQINQHDAIENKHTSYASDNVSFRLEHFLVSIY